MSTPACPPEPWHLLGEMYVSVWRVRPRDLPRWRLPAGVRPLVVAGRCTLLTFWVDYRSGGTLSYRELLVALAVRDGRGVAATAVEVWVDNEQSLRGGRELWGIPKRLGTFTFGPAALGPAGNALHTHLNAAGAQGGWADATHRPLFRLPGRPRVRTRLAQLHPTKGPLSVPLRLTGTARLSRTRLTADPAGPLAFLNTHRPRLSVVLGDFRFDVGPAAPVTGSSGSAATGP